MMDSSSVFTKMLDSAIAQHPDAFAHFDWFIEQGNKSSMECKSMEQLWLAFCQKTLYNKG